MSVAWACSLPCHTRFVAEGPPALLFDLDGTLVDSVYQHVLAWHEVLGEAGMELSVWRIHRRIGMSGGLFVNALLREPGKRVTPEAGRRRVAEPGPAPRWRERPAGLRRGRAPPPASGLRRGPAP